MTVGEIICETCLDSGWQVVECDGGASCGRWRVHRPHRFVRACPCRDGNAAYIEKQRRLPRRKVAA